MPLRPGWKWENHQVLYQEGEYPKTWDFWTKEMLRWCQQIVLECRLGRNRVWPRLLSILFEKKASSITIVFDNFIHMGLYWHLRLLKVEWGYCAQAKFLWTQKKKKKKNQPREVFPTLFLQGKPLCFWFLLTERRITWSKRFRTIWIPLQWFSRYRAWPDNLWNTTVLWDKCCWKVQSPSWGLIYFVLFICIYSKKNSWL